MIIKVITWLSRIVFGVAFIFGGLSKAVDPLGSVYIFDDYFVAFGMEWLMPLSLVFAFFLNTLEFVVGVAVLLGLQMRISAWIGLLFMAFFTPLTLYLAITDPVPHCGCFGDAWIMTNWETFYKNILILAAAIVIFIQKDKITPLLSNKKDWWIIAGLTIAVVWLSFFCLRNLPVIDFRPWKVGNNIAEKLEPIQEGESKFIFVYENVETGEKKEFKKDNLPSADEWKYIDREEIVIKEEIPSPIENFSILDEIGIDYTDYYIEKEDYHFFVVAYNLYTTNINAFINRIDQFVKEVENDGYSIIVLTSSSPTTIDKFTQEHNIDYQFFISDERELKTIVRSNPGLVLLKNGIVFGKWHHRNIPSYKEIKKEFIEE